MENWKVKAARMILKVTNKHGKKIGVAVIWLIATTIMLLAPGITSYVITGATSATVVRLFS